MKAFIRKNWIALFVLTALLGVLATPALAGIVKRYRGQVVFPASGIILAGTTVTSTGAELNIMDGVTATAVELNIMDGVTSTTAELNKVDGFTGVYTDLNFVDVTAGTLTASKALVADASSQIDIVDVTGSFKFAGEVSYKCDLVTIATADVATLNATPVQLVAAPGANKFIAVQSITVALDYASAAYDGVGAGEDLSFQYVGGSVKVSQDIDSASFLGETNDELRFIAGTPLQLAATADAAGFIPTVNAAIDVQILSGEIYAAAGDSPLDFRICYSIQPDLLD